jgi:hypothetical protein
MSLTRVLSLRPWPYRHRGQGFPGLWYCRIPWLPSAASTALAVSGFLKFFLAFGLSQMNPANLKD